MTDNKPAYKVGDTAFYVFHSRMHGSSAHKSLVKSIAPKTGRITLEDGRKFSSYGDGVGQDTWGPTWNLCGEKEYLRYKVIAQRNARAREVSARLGTNLETLTLEQLDAIMDIINGSEEMR